MIALADSAWDILVNPSSTLDEIAGALNAARTYLACFTHGGLEGPTDGSALRELEAWARIHNEMLAASSRDELEALIVAAAYSPWQHRTPQHELARAASLMATRRAFEELAAFEPAGSPVRRPSPPSLLGVPYVETTPGMRCARLLHEKAARSRGMTTEELDTWLDEQDQPPAV